MAKLTGKQIQDLARSIVAANPGGIRYSALVETIRNQAPETPKNTINGAVWNLDALFPGEIAKPSRGLFTPVSQDGNLDINEDIGQLTVPGTDLKESDFYEPFAQWLKNDLDEVTKVCSLGGAGLAKKWGTPDVVGTYRPLAKDLIKFPVEIISAEIKTDPQAPVVAFGQAVAYRLFSSKTYIVVPTSLSEENQSRLESLCMLFGVGLILFDFKKNTPQFSIRVRAQRFSPDMFYVNEFAERLKNHDVQTFEELFG